MRLAFYAPLKPPDHPTPSGDRRMAGLLMKALTACGHDVRLASRLRTYCPDPDEARYHTLKAEAHREARRIAVAWGGPQATWSPDCWFTYHPYYRAPDWLGPAVCPVLRLPYITAEASYAAKRDGGPWGSWQADVVAALRQASASFCFTPQDREGLEQLGLPGPLIDLAPFIDAPAAVGRGRRSTAAPRIGVIAMMRPGDKLASYRMLSAALSMLDAIPWRLAVIGDGPARTEVLSAFSAIAPDRIDWLGELEPEAVAAELVSCDLYVWPGTGEAYGLAYLEAQAMGLPVVAQRTDGVPAVVEHGVTGWLTPAGDITAFAAAIERLLRDPALRASMGAEASRFVREKRSLAAAAGRIGAVLAAVRGPIDGARA